MSGDTICKTVRQYSRGSISAEDMKKLQEIAGNYKQVKNYVYARFGGIGSLSKIYPGYTVQNEMTESGLRENLGLPSVYFYLAVFDALGDIKSQWTKTKAKVQELLNKNERLSEEEKHYLRFVIKTNNAFESVLNQQPIHLPKRIQSAYDELASQVDTEKLHRYLCRQVRKYHLKQHTDKEEGFTLSERAYRYGDHGIYISIKEKRKRIFIPLTDNNQYQCQIRVKLNPAENSVEIHVPIYVSVRKHEDYTKRIGLSAGIFTMLTTDEGHCYGEELGKYQTRYAEWIQEQSRIYNQNRADNPGRKKYNAKKNRLTEQMHSYINHELNRFLQEEKPEIVYVVKLPGQLAGGVSRKINQSVSLWQRGYIWKRLSQKCREQSVELVEVWGKDISRECSCCGAAGKKEDGVFICEACGWQAEEKINTARNARKRGEGAGKYGRVK